MVRAACVTCARAFALACVLGAQRGRGGRGREARRGSGDVWCSTGESEREPAYGRGTSEGSRLGAEDVCGACASARVYAGLSWSCLLGVVSCVLYLACCNLCYCTRIYEHLLLLMILDVLREREDIQALATGQPYIARTFWKSGRGGPAGAGGASATGGPPPATIQRCSALLSPPSLP